MIYYVITQTHKNPDPAAARAIVNSTPAPPNDDELPDSATDFIHGVCDVLAGNSEFSQEIRLMGSVPAWVVMVTQGVGDEFCEWMTAIEEVVRHYPGLLRALGVHIAASSGFYGQKPITFYEP